MIYTGLNRTGEIETDKANGAGEIAEVYGGIGESNPIYYKQREMVGTSPMQFKALGLPLKDYLISGNTIQNGTPTPDMPVDVVGCGVRTENLFDVNSGKVNGYIDDSGNIVQGGNPIWTYDYIDIYGGINYTYLGYEVAAVNFTTIRVAWFDANKSFISRTYVLRDGGNPRTVTTPSNARYARLSIDYGIGEILFIEGSTPPRHLHALRLQAPPHRQRYGVPNLSRAGADDKEN